MPHEWKYTAEPDAKDDWEGTQVTLLHRHTKNYRQTNNLLLSGGFFCFFFAVFISAFSITFPFSIPYLLYQVFLTIPFANMFSVPDTLSTRFLSFKCSHFLFSPSTLFHVSCVSSTSPPSGLFINYTVETHKQYKLIFQGVHRNNCHSSWWVNWK